MPPEPVTMMVTWSCLKFVRFLHDLCDGIFYIRKMPAVNAMNHFIRIV